MLGAFKLKGGSASDAALLLSDFGYPIVMRFVRLELETSRQRCEASAEAGLQAIGANFRIEENVSDLRRAGFEAVSPGENDLRAVAETYFLGSVQGTRRRHRSSTFDVAVNGHMLLSSTIEPNQKLVRLERIDDILAKSPGRCDYDRLVKAIEGGRRDDALLATFVDLFRGYPGERPAFVAFKAELTDDLREADWLERLIERLGLVHNLPTKAGETHHFALMEYTVEDVFAAAVKLRVARPFAVGSVLECRNNPAFFPVPSGMASGFAVDLGDGTGGPVRELLHVRMDYVHSHVVRFGTISGPKPLPDLTARRSRHLANLRRDTGRNDFGEPLTVGVP